MARKKDFGQLSGRLLELSVKTLVPKPYPVTDKISIDPPTKRRSQTMRDSHAGILVYQALLNESVNRAAEPKPAPPLAEPLSLPGEDPTDEAVAAHERDVADWESAVAEWESRAHANNTQMAEMSAKVNEATETYNRAFFGDAHDDVMAYFDDQPQALWEAFVADIKAYFVPNPPTADDDDEDEDEANGEGKSQSSST